MPKKLPLKIFLKTFEFVPRVAISLAIKNSNNEVLLTKRSNPPFKDSWHLPGSFILKMESIDDCIKRIGKEELGISLKNKKSRFLLISEDINSDPRGHVIDLIYELTLDNGLELKPIGNTKEVRFFEKLPEKIGFNHRKVLNKLKYR